MLARIPRILRILGKFQEFFELVEFFCWNSWNFEFPKIGNQKGFQHYKDVLKIIFFDIFARENDVDFLVLEPTGA